MTGWVLAGARSQPVVLAFEDLHWADPTSLELLRALADRGAHAARMGDAITLTTGLAAQFPSPGSAIITTVNAAVEAFVRAMAAAIDFHTG